MEETQQSSQTTNGTATSGNSYAVPVAIIVGFGMMAAAIYFGGNKTPVVMNQNLGVDEAVEEGTPVPPVTAEDHILGNPNAPIVVVEYSDFDCPFCKSFHETMHSVIDTYGPSGKVAWVYRHFPIDTLHPSAPYLAAASECVAELGGNEAFWKFADQIFQERETNQMTDTLRLPEFATTAGVDAAAFAECVDSERTVAAVDADLSDGMAAGVRGTPHSFILIAGQQLPVNGAQPIEFMKSNIDSLLKQLESAESAD